MPVALIVLCAAAVMIGVELARPGRTWPKVTGWWARAIALNAVQAGMVYVAGFVWDGWMVRHRLWNADGLGVAGGAVGGYCVHSFVYYWWHRARHEVRFSGAGTTATCRSSTGSSGRSGIHAPGRAAAALAPRTRLACPRCSSAWM